MASVESFTKQSYESFYVAADLEDVLETDEIIDIDTSTVTALKSDGSTDATDIILQPTTKALDDSPDGGTNNMVKIRVQDGVEADSPYKITFKMVTSLGNKWEVDVKMKVKEL